MTITDQAQDPAPPADLPPLLNRMVEQGLVAPDRAADAFAVHGSAWLPELVETGTVRSVDAVRCAAELDGREFVDLADMTIDPAVSKLLNAAAARHLNVLPLGLEDGQVRIAVSPAAAHDPRIADQLRSHLRDQSFVLVVAERDAISDRLEAVYRADAELAELEGQVIAGASTDASVTDIQEVVEETAVVKMVNLLVRQAVADRATDIHIDPHDNGLHVRYRIDGVLKHVKTIRREMETELVARIKIMADLEPSQKRLPQDGRVSFDLDNGRSVDLRIATLPLVNGEKVNLRILDNANLESISLDNLGFSAHNRALYDRAYRAPQGLILVVGPMGSGKSTTQYATVEQLNAPRVNIVTVENPVEYTIPGVNQVQVNDKQGLTWPVVLRSLLRADANVLAIGEIRDGDSAQIAVELAQAGRLVLATIHANDATSAAERLSEMGVPATLVGATLGAVVSQRLVRRLCQHCRAPYSPDQTLLDGLGDFPLEREDDLPTLYRAVGCRQCSETGFRGRIALHEVFVPDSDTRPLLVHGHPSGEVRDLALAKDFVPIRQDGWAKVLDGTTTIEEVLEVVL